MSTLSICIATYRRAGFIRETLESLLSQLPQDVELIVVDGASPDDTPAVMADIVSEYPQVRYFREASNSGVDGDYDKAVGYARGDYCWLMTDDDLVMPGAIARLLEVLEGNPDLVILNSKVLTADMSRTLRERLLPFEEDRVYSAVDRDALLADTAGALSFIGCVVVRRQFWLARDRLRYYGSLFVHVGVIFQAEAPAKTLVLAEPLIAIRYGNAMWTSRGFEIWMFKWPKLVWSFQGISDHAKAAVCPREPWRQFRKLLLYRSIGGYGAEECQRFLAPQPLSGGRRVMARAIGATPPLLANAMSSLYCLFAARHARMNIYDLSRSLHANVVSRTVAKLVGLR